MRAIITYKNNTDYKLLDDLDSFQIPTDNNEYLWLDLQSSDKKIERKVLEQKFDISFNASESLCLSIGEIYLVAEVDSVYYVKNFNDFRNDSNRSDSDSSVVIRAA